MEYYHVGTDASITVMPAPVPPRGRGNMTLRRLVPLMQRAKDAKATPAAVKRAMDAVTERMRQRGTSKLARRLRRKAELGMAGAF